MNYVLDTNVVLYHLAGQLAQPLPSGPTFVSVITEIELMAFKPLTAQEAAQIQAFLASVYIVDLDSAIKGDTIRMRLSGLRLPDAVIAATSLACNAELLTQDVRLLKTPGLKVSSPATI